MSLARSWAVARLELLQSARRPLFWIWLLLVFLIARGMSEGVVQIDSGESEVGGTKAWVTSEFAVAQAFAIFVPLLYGFFAAVAAGMTVLRDEELGVGAVLHATPLTAREYVWGKFVALLAAFGAVLGVHLAVTLVFNHVLGGAEEAEIHGPFVLANYLRPLAVFAVPALVFVAGTSFAVGEWTRRPILVFFLPVALFLAAEFFFWTWTPTWLDPAWDRLLMYADPTGFRWLKQTWLDVDKGVEFYNESRIPLELGFGASRLLFLAVGLGSVWASRAHFERRLRGTRGTPRGRRREPRGERTTAGRPATLTALRMSARPPGALRGAWLVLRAEAHELRTSPGLYLFVPMIALVGAEEAALALGAFETPLLLTPGQLATGSMSWLTTCSCFLLLFYTVESLRRDRGTRFASIGGALPVGTASFVAGKLLAGLVVVAAVLGSVLAVQVGFLLVQGRVPLDPLPWLVVWGGLLLPTLLVYMAFVTAAYAVTGSRYTTYGIGLAALYFTARGIFGGDWSWAGNWVLWGSLRWSDLGWFELDRQALLLNRVGTLGLAALLLVFAVRVFPRRAWDTTRVYWRLRPGALLRTALQLLPWALVPLGLAFTLQRRVDAGYQGEQAEKAAKDYWRRNVATWTDAPEPVLAGVDLELELEPADRWFHARGTYVLENRTNEALDRFPITPGFHWTESSWTLAGEDVEPEDRAGLLVFEPAAPLAPGERIELGFEHEGTYPSGYSENGGGASEFILPSGVVLTSFSPSFVPLVGYQEGVGVDEDNESDPEDFDPEFYEGVTPSFTGGGPPFDVRMRITAPEEYVMNSVGALVEDTTDAGRRTVVWETEAPVTFFNVVGGRRAVREGDGVAIYYHPAHDYNVDEMLEALEAARRHYAEWFHPYPWAELKLTEFPALAGYAQGFPTNITFSENLGFLTKSDPRANAAFMVTAHESAHQWFGNLLTPGEGPGGNILSEGGAHFATILLTGEVLGLRERIEFCKRIESTYADGRVADAERPLTETTGSRPGDGTVTYDKGGWVLWMLLNHMGREATFEALRSFIAHYRADDDHPVLQDLVRHLRGSAPDAEAYDAFCDQWFFDVVVPEYRLEDAALAFDEAQGVWTASAVLHNAGTGTATVEVAAARGERFPDDEEPEEEAPEPGPADAQPEPRPDAAVLAAERTEPRPDRAEAYLEQRKSVTLGAGERVEVELRLDFEPERLVVDPDALVLQLERDKAVHAF